MRKANKYRRAYQVNKYNLGKSVRHLNVKS
nr:MAG TPA: hypothetical protein [Caudoviricetes sp.]DAT69687.1 MAG TPA: hypothetical protein [Caudoviricetes sp.]